MATKPDDATNATCFIRHYYHDHAAVTMYSYLMYRASKIVLNNKAVNNTIKNQAYSSKTKGAGTGGAFLIPFPTKLHLVLSIAENDGFDDIISWWVKVWLWEKKSKARSKECQNFSICSQLDCRYFFIFFHFEANTFFLTQSPSPTFWRNRRVHGRCFVVRKPQKFVDKILSTYFCQSKIASFQRQLSMYGFLRLTQGPDRGCYYHEMFLKHKLYLCQEITRTGVNGNIVKRRVDPKTEPDFYSMPFVEPDPNLPDYLLPFIKTETWKEPQIERAIKIPQEMIKCEHPKDNCALLVVCCEFVVVLLKQTRTGEDSIW